MRKVLLASTIALLGLSTTAEAHFILMSPPQVNTADASGGKGSPPCGPDKGMATTPTPAQGGHPLMISVKETVGHLGFYRVALAIKSRSEIPVDNVVYDASGKVLPPNNMPTGTSDHADTQNPAVFPILADNFFSHEKSAPSGMVYSGNVTLPNLNCDRCVLQVIEFMHPHGFNTDNNPPPGGGYFYHHCAELKITADPALPLFVPPGADGGAPDASADAGKDSSGTGGSGTSGAAGSAGGSGGGGAGGATGVAGTSGAGGMVTGAAGTSGASGTNGGAGTSGVAGTSGAAGTSATGSAGSTGGKPHSSGGGCALGGETNSISTTALLLMVLGYATQRRRTRLR